MNSAESSGVRAATIGVAFLAVSVGAPISVRTILAIVVMLAVIFLLPAMRRWGLGVRFSAWNLAGLLIAFCYIGATAYAHHAALQRVDKFSSTLHLEVQSRGALPLPPSLLHWDGLVLTPRGVYELRMDLAGDSTEVQAVSVGANADSLNYRFYPDAPSNSYIEAAKRLPEVQTVLWFDRFPVIRFHKEGAEAIVEIADLRFPQINPNRPTSFTYRVRFAADQTVLSESLDVQPPVQLLRDSSASGDRRIRAALNIEEIQHFFGRYIARDLVAIWPP